MNDNHARVCTSPQWARHLQTEILPVLTRDADLGAEMLEIGPGPGAATDWLRHRVSRLTAVEIDQDAATALAGRFAGTSVVICQGSAAKLGFEAGSFDSAGSFTMLHHVPTAMLQNKILAEAFRVLRPGGVLIGSDSLASTGLHHFHADDTYNPVEPASLLTRLQTIGFSHVTVSVDDSLTFIARKAADEGQPDATEAS